jgi:isoleucyl-tRNA synthetase
LILLIVGHALNKILKDIILRYNVLQKRKVSYIPGWDCHGLPIELKVQELARKSKSRDSRQTDIRSEAKTFAEKTVLAQMEEFESWAVMGDWENSWRTMGIPLSVKSVESRSGVRD